MKLRYTAILLVLLTLISCVFASCDTSSLNPNDGWVPYGYQLASNENVDYTLFVPNSWTVDISTGVLTASTKGGNITMVASAIESDVTLGSFWEEYAGQFETTFAEFAYVSKPEGENMILSNGKVSAKKYVYSATVSGTSYQFMQVTAIVNETLYLFTFTALADSYDSLVETVNEILSYVSFDLEKAPPANSEGSESET